MSSEFPPGPGGIGTHAFQTAKNLEDLGWEVNVLTGQDYASNEEIHLFNKAQNFRICSWEKKSLPFAKFINRWNKTVEAIKKCRPDLILATGDRDIYLAVIIAKSHRIPVAVVEHGRKPPAWERIIKRWAFNSAEGVITVSRYTRQKMYEMGIRPKSEATILNGADPERFLILSPERNKHFISQSGAKPKKILLTVGSVTVRKGQEQVIKALPDILKRMADVHYFMAGLPQKQSEFTRLAEELGVKKYVHFLGAVSESELVSWLNVCDVFLMTSRHTEDQFEGFGIAVIEAALCGKPAIVNRNSGLSEAIVDGVTGISVKEDDVSATADAVVELLTDEEKRVAMGKAAKERALKEFTWPEKMKEYDRYLRTFLPK